jgi:SPOR domain
MLLGLAAAQSARYTVQFKASPSREEAEEEVRRLEAKNISAYIVKSVVPGKGVFYRVRAGVFSNQGAAKRFGDNLQQRGAVPEFFVTTYEKPADQAESATAKSASQVKATARANQPALNSAPGKTPGEAPATTPPIGFARFQDPKIGYSFDYPDYWTGQPLSDREANEQRMSAGATFSSEKDAAYLNVIWNEVDRANNPTDENDLIVNVILTGMSATDGVSKLEETSRRVENRNGLIKTYLDLKATVQIDGQSAPLDCLAKSVIIRANRGILLVAVFYTKNAAPNVTSAADRIIASARAPK